MAQPVKELISGTLNGEGRGDFYKLSSELCMHNEVLWSPPQ